jgi:oxaloacetate decarboxylase beta subunit
MGENPDGQRHLINIFYHFGLEWEVVPCLIFLGIGALTDFGPLIANPLTLMLGAAAQLGVYATFFGALVLGFNIKEAASIGIIGGADGPTTIYLTAKLAPHLLGATAVAAYSYMSMVPLIQPPIMRLLTTQKERMIRMKQLRPVSAVERILFPLIGTAVICLLVPESAPLMAMFMLGNLFRECRVVERLSKASQNELLNIVTIFLGISVGATMRAETFLTPKPIFIFLLGLVAFAFSTAGGVLLAKLLNLFLKQKINPLIGSAGVSAVPMAARVSQKVGQAEDPKNFLLMHAMGPNVAGVIGTASAAGLFLALLK